MFIEHAMMCIKTMPETKQPLQSKSAKAAKTRTPNARETGIVLNIK